MLSVGQIIETHGGLDKFRCFITVTKNIDTVDADGNHVTDVVKRLAEVCIDAINHEDALIILREHIDKTCYYNAYTYTFDNFIDGIDDGSIVIKKTRCHHIATIVCNEPIDGTIAYIQHEFECLVGADDND